MKIKHGDHEHEVFLLDSGTSEVEIEVDGEAFTYAEADRHMDGRVRKSWMRGCAEELCDDGLLVADDDPA